MKSRNERMADRDRLKVKRRYHWGQDLFDEFDTGMKGVIDTPTPCSCYMCGNPRKYSGEQTLQEKSFEGLFRTLMKDN